MPGVSTFSLQMAWGLSLRASPSLACSNWQPFSYCQFRVDCPKLNKSALISTTPARYTFKGDTRVPPPSSKCGISLDLVLERVVSSFTGLSWKLAPSAEDVVSITHLHKYTAGSLSIRSWLRSLCYLAQAGQKGSQDQTCLVGHEAKSPCSGTSTHFRRQHQLCLHASEPRSAVRLLHAPWGCRAAVSTGPLCTLGLASSRTHVLYAGWPHALLMTTCTINTNHDSKPQELFFSKSLRIPYQSPVKGRWSHSQIFLLRYFQKDIWKTNAFSSCGSQIFQWACQFRCREIYLFIFKLHLHECLLFFPKTLSNAKILEWQYQGHS